MMKNKNRIILCLGSNQDKETNIQRAADRLRGYFPDLIVDKPVLTKPIDCCNPALFLNEVAIASTSLSKEEVRSILKQIESFMGRTSQSKIEGIIPIDIDLIVWNNEVLKPDDWNRDYVKEAFERLGFSMDEINRSQTLTF